jgi:hypothetical protein
MDKKEEQRTLDVREVMKQLGMTKEASAWLKPKPKKKLTTSENVQPSQKQ